MPVFSIGLKTAHGMPRMPVFHPWRGRAAGTMPKRTRGLTGFLMQRFLTRFLCELAMREARPHAGRVSGITPNDGENLMSTLTKEQVIDLFNKLVSDCWQCGSRETSDWTKGYYQGRGDAYQFAAEVLTKYLPCREPKKFE
jgi:hypothetical protein